MDLGISYLVYNRYVRFLHWEEIWKLKKHGRYPETIGTTGLLKVACRNPEEEN